MNPVRRCAPLCMVAGAVALLCWAPAIALGGRSDADASASSVAQGSAGISGAAAKDRPAAKEIASRRGEGDADAKGRRPFTRPPGHQRRPARDVAPGQLRPWARPPSHDDSPAEPSGEVLGATPPAAQEPPVTVSGRDAPGMVEQPSRVLPPARAGVDVVRRPLSGAITNGPPYAVALGGALGVTAALSPAYGDLATPPTQNRLSGALLLIVLGSQMLAATLLISAVRDMLGGLGPPPLR